MAPTGAATGLTGPVEQACAVVTEQLVASLVDLRTRIAVLDDRIAETSALHHDAAVFTSLPRADTNRAALLCAEIGDPPACLRPGLPPQRLASMLGDARRRGSGD